MFAVGTWWMTWVTRDWDFWELLWPQIFRGVGMMFAIVPINNVALGTLPPERVKNASGLYNLMRNLGGSIGISVVNTIVARHEQLHRNELVAALDPGRITVRQTIQGMQQYLTAQGASPTTALQRSYALLGQTLTAQARLWSYVDDFRYMALACFGCVPIVFLLKKTVGKKGATSAGH